MFKSKNALEDLRLTVINFPATYMALLAYSYMHPGSSGQLDGSSRDLEVLVRFGPYKMKAIRYLHSRFLKEHNSEIRKHIIRRMSYIAAGNDISSLLEGIYANGDFQERVLAISSLSELKSEDSSRILRTIVEKESEKKLVAWAIAMLGETKKKSNLDYIRSIRSGERYSNGGIQRAIAIALGERIVPPSKE